MGILRGLLNVFCFFGFWGFFKGGIQRELLTNSLWSGTVLSCGGLTQGHSNPSNKVDCVLEEIFFP